MSQNSSDMPAPKTINPTGSSGGTQAATTQAPLQPPIVSPYINVTVTGVDVQYLDTRPVQVELVIHGTLPDQCTYDFYSIENRTSDQVKITLKGIHPSTTDCAQTEQLLTYTLLLGKDFPEAQRGFEPGSYQLLVNGYQTSFTIDT